MAERKVLFRRCLNHISQNLSRQQFDEMKFMCKDVIPYAKMEKVHVGIDLFQALEERGRLTCLCCFSPKNACAHKPQRLLDRLPPLGRSLIGQAHYRQQPVY